MGSGWEQLGGDSPAVNRAQLLLRGFCFLPSSHTHRPQTPAWGSGDGQDGVTRRGFQQEFGQNTLQMRLSVFTEPQGTESLGEKCYVLPCLSQYLGPVEDMSLDFPHSFLVV